VEIGEKGCCTRFERLSSHYNLSQLEAKDGIVFHQERFRALVARRNVAAAARRVRCAGQRHVRRRLSPGSLGEGVGEHAPHHRFVRRAQPVRVAAGGWVALERRAKTMGKNKLG
jgi:hypothetical protein